MRHLIFTGVSLVFFGIVTVQPVWAQESSVVSTSTLKPFNLVYMGYQGVFRAQGIPSNEVFLTSDIAPETLIEAAIKTGRLPAEILNDSSYLDAVEDQLRTIPDIGET